jgi:Icc-related predicted phosphoesterase
MRIVAVADTHAFEAALRLAGHARPAARRRRRARRRPARPEGCEDLRRAVACARPRLHLFGHIHQDGGFWTHDGTAFANVTTWSARAHRR